jgi:putative 4-mercaptohistidine N1-methyltranferase
MTCFYDSEVAKSQYLLLHYGMEQDLMPFAFGPKESVHFPVRCVTECLETAGLPSDAEALDLGCAVGRSSFELSRFCSKVVAVDRSSEFIQTALELKRTGRYAYLIEEEGTKRGERMAHLPQGVHADRVEFICQDVMAFSQTVKSYNVVLAANLLCRLAEPLAFLQLLPQLVLPDGQLILTTPYSWLEEYTSRKNWLEEGFSSLKQVLEESFTLQRCLDLPFLIREHYRKYQWGVAQATIWRRR